MFSKGGGLGLEPTKNACFAKMPSNILKFGSANNFSGNIGERALKGIVIDHADKTQRRPDKFAEQCAIRKYKSQASLQADYALTRCQEQRPQDPRRTRQPQEKGR